MSHWRSKSIFLRIMGMVVVLPLLASSCSSSYMIKTERITKPDQGKAMVNFVRTRELLNAENHFGVWDGNNFVGSLTYGKYIQYQTTPGEHYFLVTSGYSWSCVKANLVPDKQYVIKVHAVPSQYEIITGVAGRYVAQDPVTEADYKNGQIKDVTELLTKPEPTMPKPQLLESYVRRYRNKVIKALSTFKSGNSEAIKAIAGNSKVEILGPQDFLPE